LTNTSVTLITDTFAVKINEKETVYKISEFCLIETRVLTPE